MKYPLGIQTFREIRERNYAYVDKTSHICGVIEALKYTFLARPRRFGKSLTVSTMAELFSGDRELFKGLWAYDNWSFAERQRPVVWLRFASMSYDAMGVTAAISYQLGQIAKDLGVEWRSTMDLKVDFKTLLQAAAALTLSGRVVLLIDEYDKPIVDYIHEPERAVANRDELKDFYSVLKDSDQILEFVFITGVSAFAKVSIFSDLNNVTNLTLDSRAATLAGLTEEELDHTFGPRLQELATLHAEKPVYGATREEVRRWYNGYRFSVEPVSVYNPWSVLSYLSSGERENYWYQTGTPTWLVRAARDHMLFDLQRVKTLKSDLLNFDLQNIKPLSVLFQAGYLTIAEVEGRGEAVVLDFPNMEVRLSTETDLLQTYLRKGAPNAQLSAMDLRDQLRAGNLADARDVLNGLLADVPHQLWSAKISESIFHALIHLSFRLLDVWVSSEVSTSRGRADAVVEFADRVYIFEFKVDRSAQEALVQIQQRGYGERYASDPRTLVLVGANFNSEARQLDEWAVG